MTENNSGILRKKGHISKKNQGLQHRWKKEEVATLLLGNDKKVIYLQGYLKSRIKNYREKISYQFSVRGCRFIKEINILSFLIQHIYRSHCVMIETMSSNKA